MIDICPYEKCTGCAACMNACPKSAISMCETGVMGYIHPVIDQNLCIDCHLCERICPVNYPVSLEKPYKAFAATSKDENDLMTSTSGGASSVLVQYILRKGGVVYGCVQKNYTDIAHKRIDRLEDAYQLKGSKYVQSNIGYIYQSVKKDLLQNIPVIFTGTPCQIAGLRNYLRKPYDNLYLVDLVCHGVPSQRLLRENVKDIIKDKHILPYVKFRKKGNTSDELKFGVFIDSIKVDISKQIFPKNNYIAAFMTGVIFRKNCFSCPYAQSSRTSDITIADFWGLGKDSIISNDRGVSLMLANTAKGELLINEVSFYCNIEERPVSEAISGNGQLQNPSNEPKYRDDFVALYAIDKEKAYEVYLKDTRKAYSRMQLKNKIRKILTQKPIVYRCIKSICKRIR